MVIKPVKCCGFDNTTFIFFFFFFFFLLQTLPFAIVCTYWTKESLLTKTTINLYPVLDPYWFARGTNRPVITVILLLVYALVHGNKAIEVPSRKCYL